MWPFYTWLKTQRLILVAAWTVGTFATQTVLSIDKLRAALPADIADFFKDKLPLIPAVLHIIILLVFLIFVVPKHKKTNQLVSNIADDPKTPLATKKEIDEAVASTNRFHIYVNVLIVILLLMYSLFCVKYAFDAPVNQTSKLSFLDLDVLAMTMQDLFNNSVSLVLFLMYWELTEKTVETLPNGTVRRMAKTSPIWPGIGCLLAVTICEWLFRGAHIYPHAFWGFGLASGVACATTMSLFVGRIDNKLIGTPLSVVVLLYIYAALQPSFALLDHHPNYGLIVFIAVLFLKFVLLMFIHWAMTTGRLLYYIRSINKISKDSPSDYSAFSDKWGITEYLKEKYVKPIKAPKTVESA